MPETFYDEILLISILDLIQNFYKTVLCCIWCFWLYLSLPGCTWLYLALPGCTWLYLVLPDCTGSTCLYLALHSWIGLDLAVAGCTSLYLAVPGCIWLYLAVPDSIWLEYACSLNMPNTIFSAQYALSKMQYPALYLAWLDSGILESTSSRKYIDRGENKEYRTDVGWNFYSKGNAVVNLQI